MSYTPEQRRQHGRESGAHIANAHRAEKLTAEQAFRKYVRPGPNDREPSQFESFREGFVEAYNQAGA